MTGFPFFDLASTREDEVVPNFLQETGSYSDYGFRLFSFLHSCLKFGEILGFCAHQSGSEEPLLAASVNAIS